MECADYDYLTTKRIINSLCQQYPCLRQYPIGRSCAGREITALQLGNAGEYALFCAAVHGSEHITTNISLMFLEELSRAICTDGEIAGFSAQRAMFGRGIIFIPRVNPDGCEIALHGRIAAGTLGTAVARICDNDFTHWNANLRGVDINHNFSAGWQILHEQERNAGIIGPAPTRFGGYRPESEPETQALTELCRTRSIRHVVALHTQGEVIYWTYGKRKPPRSEKMAEILATSSGYLLDEPTGLAVGGGLKDWFIEEFCRPGFTVEMGCGKNPLPSSAAAEIYEKTREMLMLAAIM